MRIAVFLTSYQIGGVEKVFITLLNAWAKSGHNVYAYVLRNEGEFKEDVDEKVSIVNLNCVSLWKSFFKISRLLRQHRIEYFMVAKDIENIFFTVMKMFTRCRCKVIISQHNYFYISGTGKVSLIVKALPKVMKLIYRHSSHIICVAKGIEQYVKTLNVREGQTTVIYNPMDISMVEEASRKSINMTGNLLVIVVGLVQLKI